MEELEQLVRQDLSVGFVQKVLIFYLEVTLVALDLVLARQ
jgi:hypothetical protein